MNFFLYLNCALNCEYLDCTHVGKPQKSPLELGSSAVDAMTLAILSLNMGGRGGRRGGGGCVQELGPATPLGLNTPSI